MTKTLLSVAIGIACLTSSSYVYSSCVNSSGDGIHYICSGETSSTENIISSQSSLNVIFDNSYKNISSNTDASASVLISNKYSGLTIVQEEGSTLINNHTGLSVDNQGNGTTSITISGTIIGKNYGGLDVGNVSNIADIYIEQKTGLISGWLFGIKSIIWNEGSNTLVVSGDVISNEYGVWAENNNTFSSDLTIKQKSGTISGTGYAGIYAYNAGIGMTIIDVSGTVTGSIGIIASRDTNGETFITLNSGAHVIGTGGNAIVDYYHHTWEMNSHIPDNTYVTLNNGSKITGAILLYNGNDILTVNYGADVTEATVFDGGTFNSFDSILYNDMTDTDTDILNINQSLTGSSNESTSGVAGDILLTNWEAINIGSGGSDNGATLSLSGDLISKEVTTNTNGTIALTSSLNKATITANVTNGGTIDLSSDSKTGNRLTITGNYIGNNGHLRIDTTLGGDLSATDKLIINGNASGTTYVTVNNIGGTGAQTVEGIQIIAVDGVSTDNAFVKNGRIVAGRYEYNIVKGNTSGTDTEGWYLSSNNTVRPEAGAYIANLASANTLFNTTLHDRLGETQYTDLLTGEKSVTSMWIRSQVGKNRFVAGHRQLKNKTNWSLLQLGGDIAQWSSNDTNRLHLGVMAGYGRSNSDTDARLSGYSAKGSIDGYSLGFYGTWYDNDADKSGLYVDSWVLWNHFNAKVNGQELDREKYKLKGITASIESGYTFKLGGSELYNYWLQPKVQVTYMGVDADNHTESNGTKVKADASNWQSRLGVRLSANTNDLHNSKHSSAGQLFIEANWLHNTQPFSVKMDDSRISQDGARNIAEIKTGVEANILTNTNVWFNLNYQRGDHDYRNLGAMLGVKYSF